MNWKRILGWSALALLILAVLGLGAWQVLRFTRTARIQRAVFSQAEGFHPGRGDFDDMPREFRYQANIPFEIMPHSNLARGGNFGSVGRHGPGFFMGMPGMSMYSPGGNNSLTTGLLVLAGVWLGWYLGRSSRVEVETAEEPKAAAASKSRAKKSS